MKRVPNNVIAALMIFLMVFSLINTIFVSYYAEKKLFPTGKAALLGGQIGVLVNGTAETTTGTSGTGGGGGGGVGTGLRTPKIHILNFITKNLYSLIPFINDKYIAIFPESNYTFRTVDLTAQSVLMETSNLAFNVKVGELVKLDLDLDNIDDLSISYDGKNIVFISLHIPIPGPVAPPKISIEKVIQESGARFPLIIGKYNYSLLFLIILIAMFILLTYQYRRLKKLETKEEKQAVEIYKEYKSKIEDPNKIFTPERVSIIIKLNRQLQLLQNNYNAGRISKEAYNRGKEKINKLLGDL